MDQHKLKVFTRSLFVVVSLFIVYGTTIPFRFDLSLADVIDRFNSITWVPFMDDDGSRASLPDIVQNVILFLPFGFIGFFATPVQGVEKKIIILTIGGILFSSFVEFLQLFTLDRVTGVTDVITNGMGAFLGAFMAGFASHSFKSFSASHPELLKLLKYPVFIPTLITGALCIVSAMQPFDPSLDIGIVWAKIKALKVHFLDLNPLLTSEPFDFMIFALFCILLIRLLEYLSFRNKRLVAGLFSVVFAFALESSQLILISRMPSLQDMIASWLGILAGCVLYEQIKNSRPLQTIFLSAATGLAAASYLLSPYELASEIRSINILPFYLYYRRTNMAALSAAIELMLLYFPLGYYCGAIKIKHPLYYTVLALGTISAELSQCFIQGRHADITDIILLGTGFFLGMYAVSLGESESAHGDQTIHFNLTHSA